METRKYHHLNLCSYQERFLGFLKFEAVSGLLKSSETPSFVVNLITTSTTEPWNNADSKENYPKKKPSFSKLLLFSQIKFGFSMIFILDCLKHDVISEVFPPLSIFTVDDGSLTSIFAADLSVDSSANLRITRRSSAKHNGRGKTGCNVRLEGFCQNLMILWHFFGEQWKIQVSVGSSFHCTRQQCPPIFFDLGYKTILLVHNLVGGLEHEFYF